MEALVSRRNTVPVYSCDRSFTRPLRYVTPTTAEEMISGEDPQADRISRLKEPLRIRLREPQRLRDHDPSSITVHEMRVNAGLYGTTCFCKKDDLSGEIIVECAWCLTRAKVQTFREEQVKCLPLTSTGSARRSTFQL
jgi:hypothetical protein